MLGVRFVFFVFFTVVVTQRHKPELRFPSIRLVAELALLVGIGHRRRLPVRFPQLLQQPRRFPRHHHKPAVPLPISFHRFPAIEPRIGPPEPINVRIRNALKRFVQVIGDLFARRPVAVAQLPGQVLARLGQERQDRLIALFAFLARVVSLARPI